MNFTFRAYLSNCCSRTQNNVILLVTKQLPKELQPGKRFTKSFSTYVSEVQHSNEYNFGNEKSLFFPKTAKINIHSRKMGIAAASHTEHHPILTKTKARELALRLTTEERSLLLSALQEYQSKTIKDEYEGQLAASRWRSKFGRPSKLPTLGDVDPTGTYCPVPEDWLTRKYAATVPPPTTKDLIALTIANAIPFIGFGFLDNFFMLICGDYIDLYLGSYLMISTMAAAALGNTLSDVMGIGSAYYVERAANKVGVKAPELTPIQLDMKSSRWAANLGRVFGVTIGCLIGMFPLMFLKKKENICTPAAEKSINVQKETK